MRHPGVGALTALAFVLIIGDAERFRCGEQIANYLGQVPHAACCSSGGLFIGQSHLITACVETALGDDESDVVRLFVRSVATDFVDHSGNYVAGRKVSMELETVQ